MNARLRLSVHDAALSRSGLSLPASRWYFIYQRTGQATIDTQGTLSTVAADDGQFITEPSSVSGEGEAWIFQLAPVAFPWLEGTSIVLSHPVRPAFEGPMMVRADRVESQPGAVTPRHRHRGPGLRRLIQGRLLAEVGDTIERIEPADAWFESGNDPVVGTNTGDSSAAFVRVMVLPRELEGGQSSFVPASPSEAGRPRAVNLRLFGEIPLPDDAG